MEEKNNNIIDSSITHFKIGRDIKPIINKIHKLEDTILNNNISDLDKDEQNKVKFFNSFTSHLLILQSIKEKETKIRQYEQLIKLLSEQLNDFINITSNNIIVPLTYLNAELSDNEDIHKVNSISVPDLKQTSINLISEIQDLKNILDTFN
jgi:hypothetical protein